MTAGYPELVFNFAPQQNQFFVELAEALLDELQDLGIRGRIAVDEYPEPSAGRVFVLMPPHEYIALTGFRPTPAMLSRCIGISAEQPSSHHFKQNTEVARELGAVLDINRRAIREYGHHGVVARHLPLGHTPRWDRFERADRDIDILFMGRLTERRGRALASYADTFERYRCHIQLWDNSRPASADSEGFLGGDAKLDLLSRAKVVLSLHGDAEPYFEWLRMVESICAGAAIVTEHSTDMAPLAAGADLLAGGVDRLGLLCAALVDDDPLRERIRTAGYERLRAERPLRLAAEELAAAAQTADAQPIRTDDWAQAEFDFMYARRHNRPKFDIQPPQPSFGPGEQSILRAMKSQTMSMMALRRRVDYSAHAIEAGGAIDTTPVVLKETEGWGATAGRPVSVIVPLYNHAHEVGDALASVVRSDVDDWELVVIDDASSDEGAAVVTQFMDAHEALPIRLVRHPINRGLPHARNTGIAQSTGAMPLMLDSDNELRASTIRKLSGALAADPEASFAYGILERYNDKGPEGVVSAFPWNPAFLRRGNYIDALALLRREALVALGGYRSDSRIHGWEDYDLWVRMAEAERRGAFVPEMVARYQVAHTSMVSTSNISVAEAFAAIAEAAPRVMADLQIPG